MDERGSGWTRSQIRQVQLLEWLAAESVEQPHVYVEVADFYHSLADLGGDAFGIALADLKLLEERQLINQASGIGGIESLAAMLAPQGRNFLEQLQTLRADKRRRRLACRDAMVAWLYSVDATNSMKVPPREAMLADLQYGTWLAERFRDADLAEAAGWLHDQGLVEGPTVDEDPGPLRLYLTADGMACAESFDFDTGRYVEARGGRGGPVTDPVPLTPASVTNVFGNHNNVLAASPGASMTVVQTITDDQRQQSLLLAQAVEQAQGALGSGATQAAAELRVAAQPDQRDPGVLRHALERLRDALVTGSADVLGKALLGGFTGLLAHYGVHI